MGRIKRGGYVFVRWEGDHDPPHIHIYKDNDFVAKVTLNNFSIIEGDIDNKILDFLIELRREGKL
jgi:hypothetical protein